jgi:hypothetical protein
MGDQIPVFVDGAGKPLKPFDATGADGSEPSLDIIKRLPSLTNPQRKAFDKMQAASRVQKASIQDGIKSMQSQLKNRQASSIKSMSVTGPKAHAIVAASPPKDNNVDLQPSEMQQEGMMQEQVPEEEIKARIQNSTDQIKEANKQLWQSCTSILTPQQLDELDKMRHGQLIITTSAASQTSTDKNKGTISGAMTSDKPEPALESIDKENLKHILSNQTKHDKTTDFSGL